jgi:hypothetical protein
MSEFASIESPRQSGLWPHFWLEFWDRFKASLIGFICLTPAWFAICWLYRAGRPKSMIHRMKNFVCALGIFLCMFGLAFLIEVYLTIHELEVDVTNGVLINALTPILAVSLEGFAEAAKTFTSMVEHFFVSFFEKFKHFFGHFLKKQIVPEDDPRDSDPIDGEP